MLPTAIVPDVSRIAVLRCNALGDMIVCLPALEALRAAYPRAEIVLLASRWHAELLRGRPGPVDRVEAVPPAPGVSEPPGAATAEEQLALGRFFAAMAGESFDMAIQIHGGGRYSNPFVRRLGARLTVGLRTPDAEPLDRWVPYIYYQHEIHRFLEVVALVGAAPVTLEPRLALLDRDREEARAALPPDARPLVALHPGAGDPRRRWPPAHFARVGEALAAAGARVVVTGSQAEGALAAAVVAAMAAPAENLCGRLSLGGLAGLLARCRVVISNDSGPRHLAEALGTATVGVYWCGNMINAGPLSRARHRPVISWRLSCPVCGVDCTAGSCGHRESFVADAPVDEVAAHALDLL